MVASPPAGTLSVRPVGTAAFDDIYPLLLEFHNAQMSREDWRAMLFTYDWWNGYDRGYALYDGATAVGFVGTIFSHRRVLGADATFCNVSSWFVRDAYRTASILLLRPILALRDVTLLNLTPTERSYEIFARLGFAPLETERLLLPPLPDAPGRHREGRGSFAIVTDQSAAMLTGDERTTYEQLRKVPRLRHILLRRGSRKCYLVAAPLRQKRAPFAELLYIGDQEFFWRDRMLATWACFRSMGSVGLALDSRFADGRSVFGAIRRRTPRLYRPATPSITPLQVDGLYSELMTVRL